MANVLHIDGLSSEPFSGVIEPGTSLRELVERFGGTIRVEQVPDRPREPRELSAEAKAFLADYEYEDPGSVLALFWRYHSLEAEEFDTVEEAERFLESGAEWGSLAGEAVVDDCGQVTVLP